MKRNESMSESVVDLHIKISPLMTLAELSAKVFYLDNYKHY